MSAGGLIIRASTAALTHRLERAAAHLLARVPDEVANYLCGSVIVYAVDTGAHAGFVVGIAPTIPPECSRWSARPRPRHARETPCTSS